MGIEWSNKANEKVAAPIHLRGVTVGEIVKHILGRQPGYDLKLNCMNPEPKLIYKIGDLVRIKAGPFANFTGRVDGINQSKSLLYSYLLRFHDTTTHQ